MVNIQLVLGRVSQAAECKEPHRPVTFSVASNKSYKDKETGEWKSNATFHDIVVFGSDDYKQYVLERAIKGAVIFVMGETNKSKYETPSGETRYSTRVIANMVKFLPKQGDSSEVGDVDESTSKSVAKDDDDVDLPF